MDSTSYARSRWERIEHFRDLTAEAVERAQATSDPNLKALLVDTALRWLARAQEEEQAVERLLPSADSGNLPWMTDEIAEPCDWLNGPRAAQPE